MNVHQANELLACPFCRAAAGFTQDGNWYSIEADHDGECPLAWSGAQIRASVSDTRWMTSAWNRRAAPTREPADRDAVADTGLPELREHLKMAGVLGDAIRLSHQSAWALYQAMTFGPAVAAPAAPAVPAAPLVASYGPVHVVADLVRNLLTLDQSLPIYAGLHVTIDGKRRHRTRPVSTSYERIIDGKWIDPSRKDVPYGVIVWAGPAADPEPASPPSPSVDQAKRLVGVEVAAISTEAYQAAVVRIEQEIDNQLLASGIWPRDMCRQDGEIILNAIIDIFGASTGSATSTDTKEAE